VGTTTSLRESGEAVRVVARGNRLMRKHNSCADRTEQHERPPISRCVRDGYFVTVRLRGTFTLKFPPAILTGRSVSIRWSSTAAVVHEAGTDTAGDAAGQQRHQEARRVQEP